MRPKHCIVGCAVVAASFLLPMSARAEFANWFVPLPAFSTDTFTLVIQGDQTATIPAQNANDPLTNPFHYQAGPTSVTVTLDGGGNTDITYKGPAISPGTVFPYPNGEPHFGLNGGTQPPGGFKILSESWSNSGNPSTQSVPALSVGVPNEPSSGTFKYSLFYVQVNGSSVGEWFEFPFLASQPPPPIVLSNYDGDNFPVMMSDAGFFFSPTQIPLDDLNFNSLPPPGMPGSPFIPLPSLDGTTLPPGASILFFEPLPEPSSVVLLSIGVVAVAGYRWRARLCRV